MSLIDDLIYRQNQKRANHFIESLKTKSEKEIEQAFGKVITQIGESMPEESSIQDLAIETVAQLNAMTFIIIIVQMLCNKY